MHLNKLSPVKGATKRRKRVGRGPGSGRGKTSTRGNKGQKSRSGYQRRAGFEGGQMPLTRRIPKRGFVNIFQKQYEIVNIGVLAALDANTVVTPEFLRDRGIIKGKNKVKILGQGDINIPLTVKAHKFSKKAQDKITTAKGTVELI
ncbi:50S ribosomal protein L15 [candidate division TA06 bacterium DG_78]|uniref:Large ribosomal subunit protein uL15 n=1 Tax=candidate division TA06 bacterium DG_78 TaxID=1703772 RepID=A0A0S7YDD3_UNCT6|nr:MAG: 50S ribosomal protein L15 [candidate division TA06 bacterium DG_78]